MPFKLPAIAYQTSSEGYWAPVTSTLNWCEEDYYATPYAAEIVNTLTNLLFLYYGYLGIRNCQEYGHDRIFLVSFAGYCLVGVGSFLFHATLKYPMQLVDELSMIYTTCIMCYATFSYSRSSSFRLVLGFHLTILALGITLYYHYLQDPAFHQNVYALLTVLVVFRQMYVMEKTLRPNLQRSEIEHERKHGRQMNADEQSLHRTNTRRDQAILNLMWTMIVVGLFAFLGGFAIWALDNKYCSTLRAWRREIGLPWGILLEGHGWWHLMTGTGAYYYITWGIWLRHCLNGRQTEFWLDWPKLWNLPRVIRAGSSTGRTDGFHGDERLNRKDA